MENGIYLGNCLDLIQQLLDNSIDLVVTSLWYLKAFDNSGLKMPYVVTWVKTREPENPQNYCGNSTGWGSWKSASCPNFLSYSELILIGYKKVWKKMNSGVSTISDKEFIEFMKSVWYFPAEIKYRKYHTAPFPEDLPYRCIQAFSYLDDIILDPFSGSGTTCCVAKKLGRKYIGFELNEKYYKLSLCRLDRTLVDKNFLEQRISNKDKKIYYNPIFW